MMNPLSLFAMFAWLLVVPAAGETTSVASLLEKGIYNEETVGNLDEAIKIYKQIVEGDKANRALVAKAMYRLGTCQLKSGRSNDGIATFETLAAQYPEQKDVVEQAGKQISAARRSMSEAQAARKVKDAVMSISTRAEGDPEVAKALKSLADLDSAPVVEALVPYLDSAEATVRRSAIYILWRGELDDIGPAVQPLLKACSHSEDLTRGMAALALGGNKVDASLKMLSDMAIDDKSGYARRCAAYALGPLGRADAKDVLEKAKNDKDPLVRSNAEAALRMLSQSQRRIVGKHVSSFPEKVDLSTPEAACAAYHWASARMDANAVVDLSWVKIDPKELDASWRRAGKEDMDTYNKAQRHALIEEVLCYGDDLAEVISLLQFPEGKGRHPHSARMFGRINGQWKNLGEDRCPTSQAARSNFEQKKDRLRDHFEDIKKELGMTDTAGARQIAEQFLAAAASGNGSAAVRLTDPASAVAHQVKDFQKIPDIKQAKVESAYADDKAAIAITSNVTGDHKRKGPLFIGLIKERGLWVVNDVDLVDLEKSPDAAKEQLKGFLKTHPDAKSISASAQSDEVAAEKREAEQVSARAWQLWGQQEFAEAEKLFKQAVAKDPTNGQAYNGLGWSQFNQGRPLAAKLAFEECLKLKADHPGALNGLGWIARGQGQTDEAIRWWRKAIAADPKATASLGGLGAVLMEQKQYNEAAQIYDQWLQVDPSSPDAKAGLEKAKAAAK